MVQSERFSGAASQQRILRQLGQGHFNRSGFNNVGFLRIQNDESARATRSSISRRDLQPAESYKFQYTEPDHLYVCSHRHKSLRYRRSYHKYVDNLAADSIWIETD